MAPGGSDCWVRIRYWSRPNCFQLRLGIALEVEKRFRAAHGRERRWGTSLKTSSAARHNDSYDFTLTAFCTTTTGLGWRGLNPGRKTARRTPIWPICAVRTAKKAGETQ